MQKEKDIVTIVESLRPQLSREERDLLWNKLEHHLPVPQSIPSPFLFRFVAQNRMVLVALSFMLIVGGGGTALASDASRPGDFLFPLERALEDVRLRMTLSDETRAELTKNFTEERLHELREIIDEEIVVSSSNAVSDSVVAGAVASSTVMALEIEADVFTDTTVVKIELDGRKFYFETTVIARDEVVAFIWEKFPMLTDAQIDTALWFEVKDRASRPKDRGIAMLSSGGEERIAVAVQAILGFLDKAEPDNARHDELISTIANEIGTFEKVRRNNDSVQIGNDESRFEIEIKDDGDSRVEVRDGKSRVRIEEKDGEVRVRTNGGDGLLDWDDDDNDSSDRGDNDDDEDDRQSSSRSSDEDNGDENGDDDSSNRDDARGDDDGGRGDALGRGGEDEDDNDDDTSGTNNNNGGGDSSDNVSY